jgi:hypothetical protein
VDYLLVLLGCGLSLVLSDLSGLRAARTGQTPEWIVPALVRVLPAVFFLPAGIFLMWPLFFFTGRLRGRSPDLTWAEWLWGLVWLLDLALVGAVLWKSEGNLADYVPPELLRNSVGPLLRLVLLGLAGLALVLALATVLIRSPRPWTHHFGLALLLWPAVPFALLWLGKLQLDL